MKIPIATLLTRFSQKRTASDVEEELQFHIEMLERKYAHLGMSPADAKAAALRRFGNLQRFKTQCVTISKRSSRFRRVLKTSSILIAIAGLAIHILSADPNVAHVGDTLIMIAISGRLLLYVRGLSSSPFLHRTNQTSLSVVTETPEQSSQLREA